ncbi:hypothetical protein D3C79_579830 [compost metagenome]
MQLTEIKAVKAFSFKALLTIALLSLAGLSVAAEEKVGAGQPVLSVPAGNAGQGAEAGAAANDEASVSINRKRQLSAVCSQLDCPDNVDAHLN